jgi:protein-S-isoprenylcysteine O-methyltransferase Ste14
VNAEPRYLFPKRYADFVQRLRVAGGFALLIAFALEADPTRRSLVIGLPISLIGLLVRGWAAGYLAKDRELAVAGPYAYVRNPLYVGTLIAAFGFVLAARSMSLGILFAIVFLLVYLPAVELEEQHLREIFPAYSAYAARVPRFVPWRKQAAASESFSASRYKRNEEYKAALGWAAAVIWLLFRASRNGLL